ncbi:MAG: hypothetical protein COB02_11580 [Candidatus Cloacimonadota bacterium]|nr:MAG: hypothetical protein COB02_11580 [Candidatus Cloacimonadota bacterium]
MQSECLNIESLMDYLFDEIEDSKKQKFNLHIESCINCQKLLNENTFIKECIQDESDNFIESLSDSGLIDNQIVRSSKEIKTSEKNETEVFDLAELALYLKVSEKDIFHTLSKLPHFELNGKLRFRKESIDSYLSQIEQKSIYSSNKIIEFSDILRKKAI